jgi:hypothetical protein
MSVFIFFCIFFSISLITFAQKVSIVFLGTVGTVAVSIMDKVVWAALLLVLGFVLFKL